jgi:hypothetical protein
MLIIITNIVKYTLLYTVDTVKYSVNMNYYFIRQRDQQYSNCLYLSKISKISKISKNYKLNDNYRSFTLPGQIEYTFSEDLYKQFKKEINTVK